MGHVTDVISHRPYPIDGPWKLGSVSNGFRDIQWRMLSNG